MQHHVKREKNHIEQVCPTYRFSIISDSSAVAGSFFLYCDSVLSRNPIPSILASASRLASEFCTKIARISLAYSLLLSYFFPCC